MTQLIDNLKQLKNENLERYQYLLNGLTGHLDVAGQYSRLRQLFDNHNWLHIRFEEAGETYDSYMEDLRTAWNNAHQQLLEQATSDREPVAFIDCFRYTLIWTSINSLAVNIPPDLIVTATRNGIWSEGQAISILKRTGNPILQAITAARLLKADCLSRHNQSQVREIGIAAVLIQRVFEEHILAEVIQSSFKPSKRVHLWNSG